MSKNEQALIIEPPLELRFKGPFIEATTTYLTVTNPTDRMIAFKVKTTAPRTYCVRPNGGVLHPKKSSRITVMLQPFDPESEDRRKDKFMVQSMFISDGADNSSNFENLWGNAHPDELMNSKLKCIFETDSAELKVSAPPVVVETVPKIEKKATKVESKYDVEADVKRMRDEHKKLKAELYELRQENSTLKEVGLRSRVEDSHSRPATAKPPGMEAPHPAPQKQQQSMFLGPSGAIIIAILVLALGVFIGKSIL